MQNVEAWRLVGPQQLARVLVEADKAGGIRGGNVNVTFVHSVPGDDKTTIPHAGDRARAHIVLRNPEITHHVITPNDIRFIQVLVRFRFKWAVVFTVMKTFHVQTKNFSTAGVVPKPGIVAENG